MRKSCKVVIVALVSISVIIAAIKIWTNYSRKILDLEMDMCDENGNVIHVIVDAVLRRGWGESWKFHGKIYYGDKTFTDWEYGDQLVTVEFKESGNWNWPEEWINGFLFVERKEGTYYFMTYQQLGEVYRDASGKYSYPNHTNYFGPANTKEESDRISDIWVEVFRGN